MTSQSSADNAVSKIETASPLSRPGISKEYLAQNGVRLISQDEAQQYFGLAADGIQIPYHEFGDPNRPIFDPDGIPYARLRLHTPRGKQRYHSPAGTSVHGYLPHGWEKVREVDELIVVEGEFKAMALMDPANHLRVQAIGISGFYCFTQEHEGKTVLCSEIDEVITSFKPRRLIFLGDSDTALNPEFSKAAVHFAQLVPTGIEYCALTIPYDQAKGVDDLVHALGSEARMFLDRLWTTAHVVHRKIEPNDLAEVLFEAQLQAIAAKTKTEPKLQLRHLAKFCDRLPNSIGRNIIKRHKVSLDISLFQLDSACRDYAVERSTDDPQEIQTLAQKIVYLGRGYLLRDGKRYIPYSKDDLLLHLVGPNLSKFKALEVVKLVNLKRYVSWHGSIGGYPPGEYMSKGNMIAVTEGPNFTPPKLFGDATPIIEFLCEFFGKGRDLNWQDQYLAFLMWLRRFLEALKDFENFLPGQAVILAGPPDCGKDFVQSHLITPIAGGRELDPFAVWSGGNIFNGSLTGVEHLKVSDPDCSDDRGLRHFHAKLKEFISAHSVTSHSKFKTPTALKPVSRLTISCNLGSDIRKILPNLEQMHDKIIALRCYRPSILPGPSLRERQEFQQQFSAALPAFLGQVLAADFSEFEQNGRFFSIGYQHPEILNRCCQQSKEDQLARMLHRLLKQENVTNKEHTTTEWFQHLVDAFGCEAEDLFSSTASLGLAFKRAAEAGGTGLDFSPRTARVGDSRSKVTVWRVVISRADGVDSMPSR